MLLVINGSKVRISEKNLPFLGEGLEGKVYSYQNNALKLYHTGPYAYKTEKRKLDLASCRYLKHICTNCFNLPKEEVLNKKHHLVGYISDLVQDEQDIYQCSCSVFLEECAHLKEDIFTLASTFVEIDDIGLQNVIFNGKINVIDPGSFSIHFGLLEKGEYPSNLEGINMERINSFIRREILQTRCSDLLPKDREYAKFFTQFRNDFCLHLDEPVFIGERLEQLMHPNDTVEEFIATYVKKKTL